MFKKILTVFIGLSVFITPVSAQQSASPSISERLSTTTNSFELGAFKSLSAIENIMQAFYRYGIGRGAGLLWGFSSRELINSDPEPRKPDTFKGIIAKFAADLEDARSTLSQTNTDDALPFVLDLKKLWFDINSNGKYDKGEDAITFFGNPIVRRQNLQNLQDGPMEVRFDGADHAWLTAYTHALSAMAEATLAFDPTPVFEDLVTAEAELAKIPTIENTYDVKALNERLAVLKNDLKLAKQALQDRKELRRPLEQSRQGLLTKSRDKTLGSDEKKQAGKEANQIRLQLNEPQFEIVSFDQKVRFLNREIQAIEAKIPGSNGARTENLITREITSGDTRNALYALFKTLQQSPDKAHIASVENNLRGMFSQNKQFWEKVKLETDNDREWVPNPNQESAIGVTIDKELAETWQRLLQDALDVLDGRLLVTHPLLPGNSTGINIAAWFDNPSSLDLVGWIHGRAAYPYLAKGPRITSENWAALQRLTRGNAFAFSLYLN